MGARSRIPPLALLAALASCPGIRGQEKPEYPTDIQRSARGLEKLGIADVVGLDATREEMVFLIDPRAGRKDSSAYQEVEGFESGPELFLRLRSAWKALLDETLKSPRFRRYREAVGSPPAGEGGLEAIEAIFFAEIPRSWRPLPATGEEFEKKLRKIEEEMLFDPDPPAASPSPTKQEEEEEDHEEAQI
jgi:hypothetical protein